MPNWRSFKTVSSDAEASSFSECCLFSLATLEVTCDPKTKCFALTEQERPGVWRWGVINAWGMILEEGRAPTQVAAKEIAAEALHPGVPLTAGFTQGW